jgi:hypothetical protein
MRLGKLLRNHPRYGPLGCYYIGGIKILGDIISPVTSYEDYTFDLNNIDPEAYAEMVLANARTANSGERRKSK